MHILVYACGGQRKTLSSFLYHSPSYWHETWNTVSPWNRSSQFWVGWLDIELSGPTGLCPPMLEVRTHATIPDIFMWAVKIWTGCLMPCRQALLPTETYLTKIFVSKISLDHSCAIHVHISACFHTTLQRQMAVTETVWLTKRKILTIFALYSKTLLALAVKVRWQLETGEQEWRRKDACVGHNWKQLLRA